jgi:hypothetical protein
MKGQSAIEYLMTYGWMLLVVALAGGSIYSFTGSQCTETASGFNGDSLAVTDFTVSSETDNLVVLVENNGPNTVTLNNVSISSDQDTTTQEASVEISSGGSASVQLAEGFAISNECNTYDMGLEYSKGGLSDIISSGTITGGIEVVDLPEYYSVSKF